MHITVNAVDATYFQLQLFNRWCDVHLGFAGILIKSIRPSSSEMFPVLLTATQALGMINPFSGSAVGEVIGL